MESDISRWSQGCSRCCASAVRPPLRRGKLFGPRPDLFQAWKSLDSSVVQARVAELTGKHGPCEFSLLTGPFHKTAISIRYSVLLAATSDHHKHDHVTTHIRQVTPQPLMLIKPKYIDTSHVQVMCGIVNAYHSSAHRQVPAA